MKILFALSNKIFPTKIIRIVMYCFLFQLMSITASSQIVTEGLKAYYPFNGNIQDESGNDNHGQQVVNAFLTEDRFGNENAAYDFTTSDAYVDLGNIFNDVFAGEGEKFSMAVWIKPHVVMSNGNIITKISDTNCNQNERMIFLKIYGGNNRISFTYNSTTTGGNARRVMGNTELTDTNKWYSIVVTYDGSINTNDGLDRVKLFVDCKKEDTFLETSSGFLGSIQASEAHLGIGNYLNTNGSSCFSPHNFKGMIDDVYIFDHILTEEEITLLCQEGEPLAVNNANDLCSFTIPNLISSSTSSFSIKSDCIFKSYHLTIFSNTGQVVFESKNENEVWSNADLYGAGMYYYNLDYQSINEATTSMKRKSGKFIFIK